jgi:hypothetical protein
LPSIIGSVKNKNLKEWEWYSSKIEGNNIEVLFNGIFRARFTCFIRYQGIPLSKINIERDGVKIQLKVYKDVMTYKNFK